MGIRGFDISDAGKKLNVYYLSSNNIIDLLTSVSEPEKFAVIHQWLSEGIPQAFIRSPLLYESTRKCLSQKLGAHPKQLTLIGSGRIGFSMANNNFGTEFSENSDLDFSLVSLDMFQKLVKEFNEWRHKYLNKSMNPINPNEERYWEDNAKRLPNNIERGFIDHYKIPIRYNFVNVRLIQKSLYITQKKLKKSLDAPKFTNISLRVYKD